MSGFGDDDNFTNTDDNDSTPFISSHPWFWIIIPIVLLIALATFAGFVQARRRRRFGDPSLSQQPTYGFLRPGFRTGRPGAWMFNYGRGDGASGRDVEAGRTRMQPNASANANAPPTSRLNRWAWANRRPQDQNAEGVEGLNELGEAPPPYDGMKQGGPPRVPGQVASPDEPPQQEGAVPAPAPAAVAAGGAQAWKAGPGEEMQTLSPISVDEVGDRSSSTGGSTAATATTTTTAQSGARRAAPPEYNSVVPGANSALASPTTTPTSGAATLVSGASGLVTRPPPAAMPAERGLGQH